MSACITWKDLTISANIDAQITASESAAGRTVLHFSWAEMTAEKPGAEIRWAMPLDDIQYEWYPCCGMNRSLHVDWYSPEKSRISSSVAQPCFSTTSRWIMGSMA